MKIIIGDLELTAEYKGSEGTDCYIAIQLKDDPASIRKILASELKCAIDALDKSCWRP